MAKKAPKKAAESRLTPSNNPFKGMDPDSLIHSFVDHLEYSQAKDEYSATPLDLYKSLALTLRDLLFERWIDTMQTYYKKPSKRVYYLSMEFLMGRALDNAIINLGVREAVEKAMGEWELNLEDLLDME